MSLIKNSLPVVLMAALASIFLVQCADKPAPRRTSSTAYLPVGYGDASAPQQPSPYQLASYQPTVAQQNLTLPQPNRPLQPAGLPQQMANYTPSGATDMYFSPANVAMDAPPINAISYILLNAQTGKVLAARNADAVRGAASTQKILTALIVAEAGNLDKPVRIMASDVNVEPSKLGVRPGEVYTRRELLIAFLVKSSNDVANVLARDNAGSIAAFSAKMNAKARSVGATHSNFANPHGLTAPGQHSSARDMACIAMAAYRNPIIRDAVRRRFYSFRFANGRVSKLENTNNLLGTMAECTGMKTGYTVLAGRCLISCASRQGREVILVQLGTKTKFIWDDGAKLMRWGLNR